VGASWSPLTLALSPGGGEGIWLASLGDEDRRGWCRSFEPDFFDLAAGPVDSVAVPWGRYRHGPLLAWAGVAQAPHSVDNARDMMRPSGWSLLQKSSGHSTALPRVQAERR
jgi:hypothetical protein